MSLGAYAVAVWALPRRHRSYDFEVVGFLTAWTIAITVAGGVVFAQGGNALDIVIASCTMSSVAGRFFIRIGPSLALAERLKKHGNHYILENEPFYSGQTLWSPGGEFRMERSTEGQLEVVDSSREVHTIMITPGASPWAPPKSHRGDYVILKKGLFVRCHRNGHVIGPALDPVSFGGRQFARMDDAGVRKLELTNEGILMALSEDGIPVWELKS